MEEEDKNINQANAPEEEACATTDAAPSDAAPAEIAPPPTKSKKDAYLEGFRKKHPDWQDDDEEGFYGALSDQDAANEEEMNGYRSREEELSSALSGSVLNAALFMDASRGVPIPLSILKRYPEEVKAWMDDPQNSSQIEAVFQDLADRMAENKKLDEEATKNLEETNALVEQMIADGELSGEEEANKIVELLGSIAVGLSMNHLEKEWILAAKNAINHDTDVEAAMSKGEIAGRNAKIEAQRKSGGNGANTHSGLGSPNAGQRMSAKDAAAATGNSGRRDMFAGMKVNKLN